MEAPPTTKPVFIFRRSAIAAASLVLTHLALVVFFRSNLPVRMAVSDLTLLLASTLAAVGLFYGAWRQSIYGRQERIAWTVLALAQSGRALGNLILAVNEFGLHQPGFSSSLDGWYLIADSSFVIGLFLLLGASRSVGEKRRIPLDIAIAMIAAVLVSWVFVVAPRISANTADVLGLWVPIAYAVVDVLLLFWLLELSTARLTSFEPRLLYLLAGGAIAKIAAGIAALVLCRPNGACLPGDLDDTVWLISYALIGLAGLRAAMPPPKGSQSGRESEPGADERQWMVYFEYAWVGIAYLLLIAGHDPSQPITNSVLAYGTGAIILLVILRQVLVLRENHHLYLASRQEVAERRRVEQEIKRLNEKLEQRVHERTIQLEEANRQLQDEIREHRRTEEALKEIEEDLLKFKLGIERSDEAIFVTDVDGIIIYVNPGFEKIYGYTREQALGQTPRILKSGGLGREAYEHFWNKLLAKQVVAGELINKTRDGRLLSIESSANPILNEAGDTLGFLAIQRDITPRKQAEAALQRSKATLAQAEQMAHLGAWEIEISNSEDLNANPLRWSDEVYRIFGYEPGAVEVTNDLFFQHVHPDDRLRVEQAVSQAIAEQRAYSIEHRVVRPDGTERIVWEHAEIIFDPKGRPTRMLGAVQDITERKRAEEVLASRAREMAALYQNSLEINSQKDVSTLLNSLVQRAAELLGAPMGGLYLLGPDGERLDLVVAYNLPRDYLGETLRLGEGLAGRVALTGEPMMVKDYQHWEGKAQAYSDVPFRRVLGVPLKSRDRILGVINVVDDEKTEPFSEEEVRLVSLFADQAAIALENARLLAESDRRAREFTALYETTRDLATPQDLSTLLQTIVERAVALLEASCGSIFLYDAHRRDLEIVVTTGPELPVGTQFALGEGMAGRVARTLTPMIVDDYRTWEHRSPQIGEIPFSASIEVPMLYGGELIGVVAVNEVGDTTHKFTQADVRLLSLFAGQAASAVRNARLFEESQRRLRETLLLNHIVASSSSALEPHTVLSTICSELACALNLPQAGFALLDADRTQLTVVAEYRKEGRPSSLGAVIPILGNLATQYAIEHRVPVVVPNAQTDERQSVIFDLEKQLGIFSLLIVPLASRDQVIGTLGLVSGEPRDFSPDEIALAQHLTAAASQAFENAQLYTAIQQELAERKRTEDALAKERNILRTLIDSLPDYIYVKDTASRFVVANLALAHSFGKRTPEEIYGQSDFDYHAAELAAQFFTDEQEIFLTSQPLINREEFVFESTGKQKWLITTKMPLLDSQGKMVGLVGVGRDISERRRAEQALQQSEKKYRQLVETLQEGIWVIDQDAYTAFVNPRMAEMLGYSVDEMLGRHLFSFMDEPAKEMGKRYLERRQKGIREHHDFEFLRKDGSRIFTSLETAPINDENGAYAGAIAGVTDLTERKQAEEALKASEQYARNIIDSSLDMIITVDRERKIVEFNRAAETAFGYLRDDILGKNISLLYADSAEGQTVHQTTFEKGIFVREILNRRKNGDVFPSLLSAAVMRDDKGERIGVVGVSRDITEARLAEEALRRRLAELGALHTVAVASAEAPDEDTLIERATQVIGENLFPDNFGVLQIDQSRSSLRIHPSYRGDTTVKDVTIPLNQGVTGQVAATGKTVRCGDVLNQPGYLRFDARIRSELCVPLKVGDRILGVINAESARPYAFTDADERLMVTLASQLASAIDRLQTQAELRRLAITDELTGVFNRRYFFELAQRELNRSHRLGHPLTAIMLDIDHFKAVNDRYGHANGDKVLCVVASECSRHIREIDLLGRYGGEEFTILLVECDSSRTQGVAERLRMSIAEQVIPTSRGPIQVTVSLGIAQVKEDTEDIASLVDCADAAMYAAKAAGRNRVAVG